MDDPFIYGLIIISLLVFALLKSAFNSINWLQLELDKKHESYYSKILYWISKKPIKFELCINIYYYSLLIVLITFLYNKFILLEYGLAINILFVLFSGIIAIPLILLIPSSFGDYFSNKIINAFALALVIIYIPISPFIYLYCFIANIAVNKSLKANNIDQIKDSFNREDLNNLVDFNEKHTSKLNKDSGIKLFRNALEFSQIKIRECMMPRTEIIAVEINDPITEIKAKFIESGLTRILVYKDSIDNVIGFIKSKSVFFTDSEILKNIKTLPIFPESMSASKLLRYFTRTGQNIALVVDEFGGTSGIITIEDILEEIFGEINDEHDLESLYMKKLSDSDYLFSGRIEVDFINEQYGLNLPTSEEYETLGGLILNHTENISKANDRIKIDQFEFTILKVSETRLELIKAKIETDN
ncbi:MAG: HlyC/CorC family transporter [Bacteroidales bacterium]|nr:HlyC/CorC family transporter [Bacteroidales bacterium]